MLHLHLCVTCRSTCDIYYYLHIIIINIKVRNAIHCSIPHPHHKNQCSCDGRVHATSQWGREALDSPVVGCLNAHGSPLLAYAWGKKRSGAVWERGDKNWHVLVPPRSFLSLSTLCLPPASPKFLMLSSSLPTTHLSHQLTDADGSCWSRSFAHCAAACLEQWPRSAFQQPAFHMAGKHLVLPKCEDWNCWVIIGLAPKNYVSKQKAGHCRSTVRFWMFSALGTTPPPTVPPHCAPGMEPFFFLSAALRKLFSNELWKE